MSMITFQLYSEHSLKNKVGNIDDKYTAAAALGRGDLWYL